MLNDVFDSAEQIWGRFHQFLRQAKSCQRTAFGKKMQFNFTNKICKNMNAVCKTTFAKIGIEFCAQKNFM
jgi:hypothetical protein